MRLVLTILASCALVAAQLGAAAGGFSACPPECGCGDDCQCQMAACCAPQTPAPAPEPAVPSLPDSGPQHSFQFAPVLCRFWFAPPSGPGGFTPAHDLLSALRLAVPVFCRDCAFLI